MHILYIEPYYAQSHQQWIESYQHYSQHTVDILHISGRKWKWRIHGGAITLAYDFLNCAKKPDLILCSDMLNLPVFQSICQDKTKDIPVVMYFHENQISYPWSPNDNDIELNRDFHYYFINYTSSLVSCWNLFNSQYHKCDYFSGLRKYLKKMPDYRNEHTVNEISNKSSVLYLGCDLKKFDLPDKKSPDNKRPIILWNHRWEFDKNPELFFDTVIRLKKDGVEFSLVVLGEKFRFVPDIFSDAVEILRDEIIHIGYCESFHEYRDWLWKADIIPVTSIQDFFGISIVEAVYCHTLPLLPKRLSYVELFEESDNPDLFYENDKDLYRKLKNSILNVDTARGRAEEVARLIKKYDWTEMVAEYDCKFSELSTL
jgi:glycosyltransferase involved in cell wall biosynthesis